MAEPKKGKPPNVNHPVHLRPTEGMRELHYWTEKVDEGAENLPRISVAGWITALVAEELFDEIFSKYDSFNDYVHIQRLVRGELEKGTINVKASVVTVTAGKFISGINKVVELKWVQMLLHDTDATKINLGLFKPIPLN